MLVGQMFSKIKPGSDEYEDQTLSNIKIARFVIQKQANQMQSAEQDASYSSSQSESDSSQSECDSCQSESEEESQLESARFKI